MSGEQIGFKTTSDAAKILGVTPRTIARVCSQHGIGTMVSTRLRLLTDDDVEKLRGLVHGRVGNPNFWHQKPATRPAKSSPRKKKPQ